MAVALVYLFLHFSWRLFALILLSLAALFVVLVYLLAREIFFQIVDVLLNMARIVHTFLREVHKLLFQFVSQVWALYCLFFMLHWKMRYRLGRFFAYSATGVLVISSLYLSAEALPLFIKFIAQSPEVVARIQIAFDAIPEPLRSLLGKIPLFHVPELSLGVEAALFLLALLLFRHHYREFLSSHRQDAALRELRSIIRLHDDFRKSSTAPNADQKAQFLEELFARMKLVLDHHTERDVALSLMEEEQTLDPSTGSYNKSGILVVTFAPKDSPVDQGLRLAIGEGGAGKSFEKRACIYVPSAPHRVGIDLDALVSVGVTFKDGPHKKTLSSVFSVPVLIQPHLPVGVVNVSSKERNAFFGSDFDIVRVAAEIIATLY